MFKRKKENFLVKIGKSPVLKSAVLGGSTTGTAGVVAGTLFSRAVLFGGALSGIGVPATVGLGLLGTAFGTFAGTVTGVSGRKKKR